MIEKIIIFPYLCSLILPSFVIRYYLVTLVCLLYRSTSGGVVFKKIIHFLSSWNSEFDNYHYNRLFIILKYEGLSPSYYIFLKLLFGDFFSAEVQLLLLKPNFEVSVPVFLFAVLARFLVFNNLWLNIS